MKIILYIAVVMFFLVLFLQVPVSAADKTPPKSITNLKNTSYTVDSIVWTWTDPTDSDFSYVMIYENNVFQTNVSKGVKKYTFTGLSPATKYTISTHTVDRSGNINKAWVNKSATTKALDIKPPKSITNLKNIRYTGDSITWTWTDPNDSDFTRVMVFVDGGYIGDVKKGTQCYKAQGLTADTAYTIGTHTVDSSGNVNQTWVNNTVSTRSEAFQNLTISFINVGYGDSILIESPSYATMLVDAGASGNVVANYLNSRGVSSIDIALITHPHGDHYGGMPYILNKYKIYQFIDNGQTSGTYNSEVLKLVNNLGIPYRAVKCGKTIDLDPLLSIQVLNPQSKVFGDLNEDSIVLKIVYNQDSFLLMGDSMSKAENAIISGGGNIDVDILKVGHHGDNAGSTSTFLKKVTPAVSVISVGSNDSGLPSSTLITRLKSTGSTVYRTDTNGNIVVTSNGLNYTVTTSK